LNLSSDKPVSNFGAFKCNLRRYGEEAAADKRDAAERVAAGKKPSGKPKTGLVDAVRFVMATPPVLCLAIMSVAQGLSSILFQVGLRSLPGVRLVTRNILAVINRTAF
jgi:hypothetical protein